MPTRDYRAEARRLIASMSKEELAAYLSPERAKDILSRIPEGERAKYERDFQRIGAIPPSKDSAIREGLEGVGSGLIQALRGIGSTANELGLPGGRALDARARNLEANRQDVQAYEGYTPLDSFRDPAAFTRTAGQGIGTTIGGMAGTVAGAGLGALAGGPAGVATGAFYGGAAAMFGQEFGPTLEEYRKAMPHHEEGDVVAMAALSSIVKAAIEQGFGPQAIVSRGLRSFAGAAAKDAVADAAKKSLAKAGLWGWFKTISVGGAKASLEGGFAEGGEEVTQLASDHIIKALGGADAADRPGVREYVENAVAGIVGGGVMGAPAGAFAATGERVQAMESDSRRRLRELIDARAKAREGGGEVIEAPAEVVQGQEQAQAPVQVAPQQPAPQVAPPTAPPMPPPVAAQEADPFAPSAPADAIDAQSPADDARAAALGSTMDPVELDRELNHPLSDTADEINSAVIDGVSETGRVPEVPEMPEAPDTTGEEFAPPGPEGGEVAIAPVPATAPAMPAQAAEVPDTAAGEFAPPAPELRAREAVAAPQAASMQPAAALAVPQQPAPEPTQDSQKALPRPPNSVALGGLDALRQRPDADRIAVRTPDATFGDYKVKRYPSRKALESFLRNAGPWNALVKNEVDPSLLVHPGFQRARATQAQAPVATPSAADAPDTLTGEFAPPEPEVRAEERRQDAPSQPEPEQAKRDEAPRVEEPSAPLPPQAPAADVQPPQAQPSQAALAQSQTPAPAVAPGIESLQIPASLKKSNDFDEQREQGKVPGAVRAVAEGGWVDYFDAAGKKVFTKKIGNATEARQSANSFNADMKAEAKKEAQSQEPESQEQTIEQREAERVSGMMKTIPVPPRTEKEADALKRGSAKQLKVQKEYLLDELAKIEKEAPAEADDKEFKRVTIAVPDDGEFTIPYTKEGARTLRKNMAFRKYLKPFSTQAWEPPGPPKPSMSSPTAPKGNAAKLTLKGAMEVAKKFTSDDETRLPLMSVNWNGEARRLEASHGAAVIIIPEPDGHSWKLAKKVDGFPSNLIDQTRPAHNEHKHTVDAAEAWQKMRLAQAVLQGEDQSSPLVRLVIGTDGQIGVTAIINNEGAYQSDNAIGGRVIAEASPTIVMDAIDALLKVGNKTVSVEWNDDESPITFVGVETGAAVWFMPMRQKDGSAPGAAEEEDIRPEAMAARAREVKAREAAAKAESAQAEESKPQEPAAQQAAQEPQAAVAAPAPAQASINPIPYSKDLDIRNLDALPRGLGARYLEVMHGEDGAYVAKAWRRSETSAGPGALLIDFASVLKKTKKDTQDAALDGAEPPATPVQLPNDVKSAIDMYLERLRGMYDTMSKLDGRYLWEYVTERANREQATDLLRGLRDNLDSIPVAENRKAADDYIASQGGIPDVEGMIAKGDAWNAVVAGEGKGQRVPAREPEREPTPNAAASALKQAAEALGKAAEAMAGKPESQAEPKPAGNAQPAVDWFTANPGSTMRRFSRDAGSIPGAMRSAFDAIKSGALEASTTPNDATDLGDDVRLWPAGQKPAAPARDLNAEMRNALMVTADSPESLRARPEDIERFIDDAAKYGYTRAQAVEWLRAQKVSDRVRARLDEMDGGKPESTPENATPKRDAWVSPDGLARVEAEVERLNRKASRLGMEPLSITIGESRQARVIRRREQVGSQFNPKTMEETRRIPIGEEIPSGWTDTGRTVTEMRVTLNGEVPKLNGWHFVAVVDHLGEDGNIIRELPGETMPTEYREEGPVCEHCNTKRDRKQTFILRHDNGGYKRCGRTCLKDFLGVDNAEAMAKRAEMVGQLAVILGESELRDEGERGAGGSPYIDLRSFMPYVAAVLRKESWVSRSAVKSGSADYSTADVATNAMFTAQRDQSKDIVTPEDRSKANAAIEWASAFRDRDDVSSLEHNMGVLASAGFGDFHKHLGIAAWIMEAYRRNLGEGHGEPKKPSEYQGEIGKRSEFGPLMVKRAVNIPREPFDKFSTDRTMHVFEDGDGNAFIWTTATDPLEVGKSVMVKATVKAHTTYKGTKQTVLNRVVVLPQSAPAQAQPQEEAAPDREGESQAQAQNAAPAEEDDASAPAEQGKIDDFGEKIGGARKDTATSGRGGTRRAEKKDDDGNAEPPWRKQYVILKRVAGDGFVIGLAKRGMSFAAPSQVFATEEEAERALPLFAVARSHAVHEQEAGKYAIFKRVGKTKLLRVVQRSFDSREEAMKHMAINAVDLLNQRTSFGEEILPTPEIANRVGPARRTTDATREMFIETFAPRGIEFGNWNNQAERQMVMNHAYDGMLDLAEVLGVPPKALMLDGELAIAFGARGQGLSGARAHYETDYGVINLTKMHGAGSLAHEWFHALDHYLARQDTKASSERKPNARGDMTYPDQTPTYTMLSHGPSYKSKLRAELKEKYQALIQSMLKRAEKYVEDTNTAEKFIGNAKQYLRSHLDTVRRILSEDTSRYRKRFSAPASAEQLAEFDKLADMLVEGAVLDLKWVASTSGRLAPSMQGHYSNTTLDAISDILQKVRGQSGFAKSYGVLNDVSAAMNTYKGRLDMLEKAKGGVESTRTVATNYAIEAKKMDQARAGDYWSEPHEMAARAFAAYVEDKIAERGGQSDFIVYHAHGGILLPMIDGFIARPYPEGSERKAINAMFDTLFSTIKTRTTDSGGVAMYRTAPAPAATARSGVVTAAQDAEYMAAVERGDVDAAQRMVDEAALAAGYNVGPVWHGGRSGFHEFRDDTATGGTAGGEGVFFSTSERIAKGYARRKKNGRVLRAFVKSPNHVVVEGEGSWKSYRPDMDKNDGLDLRGEKGWPEYQMGGGKDGWIWWPANRDGDRKWTRRNFPADLDIPFLTGQAKRNGYTGVTVKNISDAGRSSDIYVEQDTVVVFDPSQIKSADAITRDDAGRVIPLSERFNDASPDIRFRDGASTDSAAPTAPAPSSLIRSASPADQARARETWRRIVGTDNIAFVDRIFERGAERLGKYSRGWATIATGQGDINDTTLHEAVHAAMDMLLTEEERAAVLAAAGGSEERAAEGFIAYANERARGGSVMAALRAGRIGAAARAAIEKLWRFVKRLGGVDGVTGKTGADALRAFYEGLAAGEYAKRGAAAARVEGAMDAAAAAYRGEAGAEDAADAAAITPEQDAEYMAAVERGDMDAAQRMVDEAAKRAGYGVGPVWHGSNRAFTAFDSNAKMATDVGVYGKGHYFTPDREYAEKYGKAKPFYVRMRNPATAMDVEHLRGGQDSGRVYVQGLALQKRLRRAGFDGVVDNDVVKDGETVAFDAEQIKSADAITRDDAGRVIPLSERFNASSDDIRFRSAAWHGSPHRFDKFTTSRIGTGEGQQAYGWGLYFAGKREVAEHYRNSLSQSRVYVGGNEVQIPSWDARLSPQPWVWRALANQKEADPSATTEQVVDRVRKQIKAGMSGPLADTESNAEQTKLDILEAAVARGLEIKNDGSVYAVDLAPQEDEYLLWDESLADQSEKVKDAIRKIPVQFPLEELDGQGFYNNEASYWAGKMGWRDDGARQDEATSKYLRKLGIRGIKYLDGGSRGRGEGSYNYVIFDESDVSVTARYRTASPDASRDASLSPSPTGPAPHTDTIRATLAWVQSFITELRRKDKNARPDITKAQKLLSTIAHYSEEVPALRKIYEAALQLTDAKHRLGEYIFGPGEVRMADLRRFIRHNREAWSLKIQPYLWEADRDATGPAVRREGGKFVVYDAAGKALGSTDSEDAAWTMAHNAEAQELMADGWTAEEAGAVLIVREINDRAWDMLAADARAVERLYKQAGLPPPQVVLDEGQSIDLQQALREMGDRRGYYMPRLRKSGRYVLKARKDGANPLRMHFDTPAARAFESANLRRQGYEVVFERNETPSEAAFLEARTAAIEDIINNALKRFGKDLDSGSLDIIGVKAGTESYTRKDGTSEKQLVLRGEFNEIHNRVFKDFGGQFYEGAWRFEPAKNLQRDLTQALLHVHYGRVMPLEGFAQSLAETMADVIRSRGSQSRKIGRREAVGEDVVVGYEEDALKAISMAGKATAGGMAKRDMVRKMMAAFTGHDESWDQFKARMASEQPSVKGQELWIAYDKQVKERRIDSATQPEAFSEGLEYIRDMSRNEEPSERVVGIVKGLAAMKYLSGVAPAMVNMTNLGVMVPAVLNGVGHIPMKRVPALVARGLRRYGQFYMHSNFGKGEALTGDDAWLFREIQRNGWDEQAMNREAVAAMQTWGQRTMAAITEKMMLPFAVTEKFNRASTIAAGYWGLLEKHEGDITASDRTRYLKQAKEMSDKAHGVYGKANLPALARGASLGAQVFRSGYVFKTFSHNFLAVLVEMGFKRRELPAVLTMMLAPAVMGGVGAIPLKDLGKVIAEVLVDMIPGYEPPDDIEEALYDAAEELFGSAGERTARAGLAGLAGFDLRGSLSIGVTDIPTTISDLLGAPWSVMTDLAGGASDIAKGDMLKGAEKLLPRVAAAPIKGYRESVYGVTSRNNQPVYYGNEQLRAGLVDAAIRAAGFSPARISTARDEIWNEKLAGRKYDDARGDIYRRIRSFWAQAPFDRDPLAWAAVLNDIQEYNARAAKATTEAVPFITPESIKRIVTVAARPPKREALRGQDTPKREPPAMPSDWRAYTGGSGGGLLGGR